MSLSDRKFTNILHLIAQQTDVYFTSPDARASPPLPLVNKCGAAILLVFYTLPSRRDTTWPGRITEHGLERSDNKTIDNDAVRLAGDVVELRRRHAVEHEGVTPGVDIAGSMR